MEEAGMNRETLSQAWGEVSAGLQKKNLIMVPPLPDTQDEACVRIFRCDSLLGEVLMEILHPTPTGDRRLVRAIQSIQNAKKQHTQEMDRSDRHSMRQKDPLVRPSGSPRTGDKRRRQGQWQHKKRHPVESQPKAPGYTTQTVLPDPMEKPSGAHYTRALH